MPGWLQSEQVAGFGRNRWLASSESAPTNPFAIARWPIARMAQDSDRTGDEQAADVFVTPLAGASQPLLATTGVLPRRHPQPGSEFTARFE